MDEPLNFNGLITYFGITDQNPTIKIGTNINVFSTNVFIPMNGKIDYKSYLYFTGFIKLIETFLSRTKELNKKDSPDWMLFIYYDDMFEQDDYPDDLYKEKHNNNDFNNDFNKEIKETHAKFGIQFKQLLELYKSYIRHIKENITKYHFVKLYSYKCEELKRKFKHQYLGHPETFGSVIRFIPLFDPNVSRVFCINISHAISPKLSYLISDWILSNKSIITNGYSNYPYKDIPQYLTELFYSIKYPDEKKINMSKLLFNPRILAGLFGFFKKEKGNNCYFSLQLFYNIIKGLIDNTNFKKNFNYGFDEIILGIILNCNEDALKEKNNSYDDIYYYKINNQKYNQEYNEEYNAEYDIKEITRKFQKKFIKLARDIRNCINIKDNLDRLNNKIPEDKKTIIKIGQPNFCINLFYKEQTSKEIEDNITLIELLKNESYSILTENCKLKDIPKNIFLQTISDITSFYFDYKGSVNNFEEINILDDELELQKKIVEQYNNYKLKPSFNDTLSFIKERISNYRFIGRDLMIYIDSLLDIQPGNNYLTYITKKDDYNFASLLDSYDEKKPLYLYFENIMNNETELDNDFFTNVKLDKSSNIKKIVDLLISYYSNPDEILLVPYKTEQRGGFIKYKLNNKQTNHNKTKKNKLKLKLKLKISKKKIKFAI